jgi:hypothetical protein
MATERPDADELARLADAVVDEATFLRFLSALAKDFREHREAAPPDKSSSWGRGALGWEIVTVDGVMDAAVAWGRDSAVPDVAKTGAWHRVAAILLAGKGYE